MDIIPAIIPKTKEHLFTSVAKLDGAASQIQIDLVDGIFVPHAAPSWPWATNTFVDEMYTTFADLSETLSLEIDLMVARPEEYIEELVSASVARVVVHAGSTDNFDALFAFHSHVQIGLAFKNDTPLDLLDAYHDRIHFVQCMGIAEIGVQGNPFDERVLARIADIHTRYPSLEIAVDGGVSAETIPRLKSAGATRLISGSAILGSVNPPEALSNLQKIADA